MHDGVLVFKCFNNYYNVYAIEKIKKNQTRRPSICAQSKLVLQNKIEKE